MDIRCTITDCTCGLDGAARLTLTAPNMDIAAQIFNKLRGKELDASFKRHSEKRSLGANALMWKCLGGLAEELGISNTEAYLQCLRDYGTHLFIVVQPEAVEFTMSLYRIADNLGEVYVGNEVGVQLRVWPGTSKYNKFVMTRLLNGIIQECKDVGAWFPEEQDVAISIERWKPDETVR